MINDEFEELLISINKGFENQSKASCDEVILKTYRFFNRLKDELKEASEDEKDELLDMVKVMHEKMGEFAKKSSEMAGMSEKELLRLSDDSDLFSPDQKHVLEMTRKEVNAASKAVRKHMTDKQMEHKAISLEDPPKKNKPKKKSGGPKKKRRDDWMKS